MYALQIQTLSPAIIGGAQDTAKQERPRLLLLVIIIINIILNDIRMEVKVRKTLTFAVS